MAPRVAQTPVRLNIYDLSEANDYMGYVGLGLFHSGVEIAGDEYSFASGAGVFAGPPRQAPGARFRESIDMGVFPGSASEARSLALSLRGDFDGKSYHLLTKNCNTYADTLCQLLLNKRIPAHINRAAYIGSYFGWLLPDDLSGQAPVGDSTSAAATGGSHTSTSGPPRPNYAAFAGSGMAMSGTTNSRAVASASTDESAASRREKMRQAALQRLQTTPST